MSRRVTQKTISQHLDVSQALVSLVTSGRPSARVSEDMRQRVLSTASELGYTPDRSAQMLRLRQTKTIACVVPDITNPFYPALERGVQEAALAAGFDVIAINTDGLHEREQQLIVWARQGRVDGIIGVFFTLNDDELEAMATTGVPVVALGSHAPSSSDRSFDWVYIDNSAAAEAATDHLIRARHTRIMMIGGEGGPGPDRVAGYRRAMNRASLTSWVEPAEGFTELDGQAAMRRALDVKRPTAVFAANDLMAAGAILVLHEAGIRIPDQVAVIGFDDIDFARLLYPALTTVRLSQRDTGRIAAEALLQRLGDKRRSGVTVERPFELVIRQSA